MELQAVEESRVDEDDMRAVERVVVRKVLRKEIFFWMVGPTDTDDSYSGTFINLSPLRLHYFTDNAPTLYLHSFTDRWSIF
jgi:hypothetical protein